MNERLKLPKDINKMLFSELKNDTKSKSIKEISYKLRINYNTFKQWASGNRTIPLYLLNKLSENKREFYISNGKILDRCWGASLGARITNEKIKKGLIKTNSAGVKRWHKIMKKNDTKKYSKMQRKRWLSLLKIFKENKELREKAQKTLLKRHGKDFYIKIGNRGAENARLNRLELKVKKQNKKLKGISYKFHKRIGNNNIDIVYYKNKKICAFEEIVGLKKKKSSMFYDIAKIKYKIEKIKPKIPFIISMESRNQNWKSPRNYYPEILKYLLKNNIVPIILDDTFFIKQKENLISNSNLDLKEIKNKVKKELRRRNISSKRGAKCELNTKFIESEENIRNVLNKKVKLFGKRILETKYGTYFVSDESSKNTVYFFSKRGFKDLIGYGFMVKKLVDKNLKVVGVVLERDKRITKVDINLMNKYVDKVYWGLNKI